jgi:hypothetical protein
VTPGIESQLDIGWQRIAVAVSNTVHRDGETVERALFPELFMEHEPTLDGTRNVAASLEEAHASRKLVHAMERLLSCR